MSDRGIIQSGLPPYTMECLTCGWKWDPKPVTQGPTKGQHTDGSSDLSAKKHRATCPSPSVGNQPVHPLTREWLLSVLERVEGE